MAGEAGTQAAGCPYSRRVLTEKLTTSGAAELHAMVQVSATALSGYAEQIAPNPAVRTAQCGCRSLVDTQVKV